MRLVIPALVFILVLTALAIVAMVILHMEVATVTVADMAMELLLY